jgi:hypothetical protein
MTELSFSRFASAASRRLRRRKFEMMQGQPGCARLALHHSSFEGGEA